MNAIERLVHRVSKPHFLFRPRQIVRRLAWALAGPNSSSEYVTLPLPWGLPIRCRPDDAIGGAIGRIGVFELIVTEALWRLADPGELAVDAGANIGYMTSVLAARLGPRGRVIAFEPHPEIYRELETNVEAWSRVPTAAAVDTRELALSCAPGRADLVVGREFAGNRGVATLATTGAAPGEGLRWPIELTTLDESLGPEARVGVMKVDVEGHEYSLFQGARRALAQGRIRDIVFESLGGYPSPVTELLEGHGYRIYALVPSLMRPRAVRPSSGGRDLWPPWEAANCLATLDSDRAVARLGPWGWRVLRG